MPNDKQSTEFPGFASPNYTPVPDELFDELLSMLTGSELKVLLYIIRRTFGFKRTSDNISLSQMLQGIVIGDGRVLDRGAGIKDKKTLLDAINKLEAKGIILTTRQQSSAKGNEPTTYQLHFRDDARRGKFPPPLGGNSPQGGGGETPPSPRGEFPPIQETVIQETDFDNSNFERQDRFQMGETRLQRRQREDGHGEPGEPRAINTRTADANSLLRDETPGAGEEREQLRAFLTDFAIELGDEAPLASTITRAVNIFRGATVPLERRGDLLYQARGLTQEHTAQIHKTANGDPRQMRRKNKMPYFLATLEQLAGASTAGNRSND